MISALCGYKLTDVRTYWKNHGNGQSTFARNIEATAHWFDRLRQKLDARIVQQQSYFFQLMLQPDRSLRPSAQQVVDQLSDLKRLFRSRNRRIKCCNPATPISAHHHDQLLRLFPAYNLFDYPIRQIFNDLCDYLRPRRGNSCRCIVLDKDLRCLRLPLVSHFPTLCQYFEDEDAVADSCSFLYANASRTGTTKDFWTMHKKDHPPSPSAEFEAHVIMSMRFLSLKHLVFTARTIKMITVPGSMRKLRPHETVTRTAIISLLPVCLPRSPYIGTFFYIVSFRDLGEQLPCSPSSNELIDLTI